MNGYSPDEMDKFLDDLQDGVYDGVDPNEIKGKVDENGNPITEDDTFDVNAFINAEDGAQLEGTSEGTVPNAPPATHIQIDPVELQRQLAEERGKNAAYASMFGQMNQPQQTNPAPQQIDADPDYIFGSEEAELTDEEKEMMQRSAPLVTKVAKQIANEIYRREIRPLKQSLQQQVQGQAQRDVEMKKAQFEQFRRELHKEMPELATISATPEFIAYMKQAAPRSGGRWTNEQDMQVALENGNWQVAKEIVQGYKPLAKPQGAQNVAPGRPQSGTPPTSDKGSKMLPYSKLTDAENKMNAGLITPQQYMKVLQAFQDAELEGRVDYNS